MEDLNWRNFQISHLLQIPAKDRHSAALIGSQLCPSVSPEFQTFWNKTVATCPPNC